MVAIPAVCGRVRAKMFYGIRPGHSSLTQLPDRLDGQGLVQLAISSDTP
jgi:hypothetical protein